MAKLLLKELNANQLLFHEIKKSHNQVIYLHLSIYLSNHITMYLSNLEKVELLGGVKVQ